MGVKEKIQITGKYRVGDIRHCCADLTRINSLLGYTAKTNIEDGMSEFAEWALKESSFFDSLDAATSELAKRGLFR
jgi:dTDP-L-rhamnose 4-epimerase